MSSVVLPKDVKPLKRFGGSIQNYWPRATPLSFAMAQVAKVKKVGQCAKEPNMAIPASSRNPMSYGLYIHILYCCAHRFNLILECFDLLS